MNAIEVRPSLHGRRRLPLRSVLLAAALAYAFSPTAVAQDASGESDETAELTALDVVTVTAQRRVEEAQDVPIAISTVSGEKLDVIVSGGDDLRVLSGRLPSLVIESSFGRAFPRFYVRGLGNIDFDLNASQPVSLIYDEVVQENPILKGFPIFDLERVEMLRGPQGTLFGRNTPAGVVKFESRRPTRDMEGYAQFNYGSFGNTRVEAAFGGPINDVLTARLSGVGLHRDDWVDNDFSGESNALGGYDEFAVRFQLQFDNGGPFNALFNVHGRDLDGTARLFRANLLAPGTNQIAAGFDRDRIAIDGGNEQRLSSHGGSARLSWDLGRVTLHSVTGYEAVDAFSRGDIDGGFGAVYAPPYGPGFIPFTAESADGMPDHSQLSQEFRIESNDWGALDWQAGLFWFDEHLEIDSFNYDTLAPGRPSNGYARQEQDNAAWAAFASLEYDVTDDVILRAGVRYTEDSKDFVAERLVSPFGAPPTGLIAVNTDDNDVSWDLSATWALDENTNLYGRVARGFRAPSIQGRLLFGDIVSVADSETVLSWELGYKTEFWNRRARANIAIYRYTADNQQLTAVGGATNFNTLINADKSVGQGIELDFEALLGDNLLVTLGGSYNDTEIRDDTLAVAPCGGGCTVLDPIVTVGGVPLALINGNPLPNAAKWIGSLTARYGIPMENGEFYVYTDWAYRGEVSFMLYESAEFIGDPLLEGGLRLGYSWGDGRYDLALFGRNILDETDVVGGIDFNNLTGFVNEPRLFGIEFKAGF
ncbi:MAG: TonB-dependent receptor [Lysobacteraceae bacterium]